MIFKTIISFLSRPHPNPPQNRGSRGGKSRRDNTLLTVDFNLRKDAACHVSTNPAGMTLLRLIIVSSHAGLCAAFVAFPVRRLKPTVNKVLSLRDISPLTTLLQLANFSMPLFLKSSLSSRCIFIPFSLIPL